MGALNESRNTWYPVYCQIKKKVAEDTKILKESYSAIEKKKKRLGNFENNLQIFFSVCFQNF